MSFRRRAAAVLGLAALTHGVAFARTTGVDAAPDEPPTHLVKVLRTSNKAQTNRYVPKVYDFRNVNPYAATWFVRRFMEIEESAWFSFANEEKTGGKMLVIVPEYQIPGLDRLMAVVDREGMNSATGTALIRYPMKNRDAFDPGLVASTRNVGTPTARFVLDDQANCWLIEDSPSGAAQPDRNSKQPLVVHDLGAAGQAKGHLPLIKFYDPVVGDGDSLGVFAKSRIGTPNNLLSSTTWARRAG